MNTTTAEQPANASGGSKSIASQGRREAVKNEIIEGKLTPMRSAGRGHNLIATNCVIAIGGRMQRGSQEMYAGDMQVAVGRNSICYPDVVVVAGEPVFADGAQELLQNPTLVIDIVAGPARNAGATQKLEWFLALPHIKEYLLVHEDEMRVEHYARQNPKQWIYRIYNERDDVISLEAINCKVSLSEIYAQVRVGGSELSSKAVN